MFTNLETYESHFSEEHISDNAGLYNSYKDFNVDSKINNLTYKDLTVINQIKDPTQKKWHT